MLKKLELSASQHQGWDQLADRRAAIEGILKAQEKRFLTDCLMEIGGLLTEPWQFDEPTRVFWMNVDDDKGRVAENLPTAAGGPGAGEN